MRGKDRCKILKEIRQKIADENNIEYITRECTYKGECSGTCPKCESELHYLEKELEKRNQLGKKVAVASLCTSLAISMAGCSFKNKEDKGTLIEDLTGIVGPYENYDYTSHAYTNDSTTQQIENTTTEEVTTEEHNYDPNPHIEGVEDITVPVGTSMDDVRKQLISFDCRSTGYSDKQVTCKYSKVNPDVPGIYEVSWSSSDGASLITHVTVTEDTQENITEEVEDDN